MYSSKFLVNVLNRLIVVNLCVVLVRSSEEVSAKIFLNSINKKAEYAASTDLKYQWKYVTDLTEENLEKLLTIENELAEETRKDWQQVLKFDYKKFVDPDVRRQFEMFSNIGTGGLPPDKLYQLNRIINEMEELYSTATICDYRILNKCDLKLEPDLVEIMANSRDPEELKHAWKEWRNVVGGNLREKYKEYVELMNAAALVNRMSDASELWLQSYEVSNFKELVQNLWKQVKPLYNQLHAYVRFKLHEVYGNVVPQDGPIPAHLLGNMWGQSWSALANFTIPFPERKHTDITESLTQQGYTPLKLLQAADDFLVSLNLTHMPDSFWTKSMYEKPHNKEVVCHPTSWYMYTDNDVRMSACMKANHANYLVSFFLLGALEYSLYYQHLPYIYQSPPNPSFLSAVGQLMSLSASTVSHYDFLKLTLVDKPNSYNDLNVLFVNGLDRIAFLPFAYLLDLWRWEVFSGKILPKNYNCKWWDYVHEVQGIQPPVERSEANLDPVSKYHVVGNHPYIDHFLSFILQFQFYKALCIQAGEYNPSQTKKPLHECNIYGSAAAGNSLKEMMQLGASKPWPNALEALTGERKMDASALIEYFSPLTNWLTLQNRKNKVTIGWGNPIHTCKASFH